MKRKTLNVFESFSKFIQNQKAFLDVSH